MNRREFLKSVGAVSASLQVGGATLALARRAGRQRHPLPAQPTRPSTRSCDRARSRAGPTWSARAQAGGARCPWRAGAMRWGDSQFASARSTWTRGT